MSEKIDFKGIIESQEGNELALKYADAIIAGLPPKRSIFSFF